MAPPPGLTPPSRLVLGNLESRLRSLANGSAQLVFTWGSFSYGRIPFHVLLISHHLSLEIDCVTAAHAIWLAGRTIVVLTPKWSQDVMGAIFERTGVKLVLYGNTRPSPMPVQTVCTLELIDPQSPTVCPPPASYEAVHKVPVICSVTPTSGSTGVPKSITYFMNRALSTLNEESSTLLMPKDGHGFVAEP